MELKAQSLNVNLIIGKVKSFSPDNLSDLIAHIACEQVWHALRSQNTERFIVH